jgi:tRNA (guanosine-2'-O-)-methyltransferase
MRNEAAATFRQELPSPIPVHPVDILLTTERARKYRQVLARRTARVAIVVEECYDPHNATAIIRSCDAFGIQRLFVVAARNGFKINRRISQGSHHYVDILLQPDIASCYAAARAMGYRVLASDLSADAVMGPGKLAQEHLRQPLALVFGTEGAGLSEEASRLADGHFLIPMVGFPQSLNLSVSVAVSLYSIRRQALEEDLPGDLTAEQQSEIYDRWVRSHKGAAAEKVLAATGRHGEDLDVLRSGPAP